MALRCPSRKVPGFTLQIPQKPKRFRFLTGRRGGHTPRRGVRIRIFGYRQHKNRLMVMARGKQTDPTSAVLAKVMHEMGFPAALIAELAQLPRKTVDDIIRGRGPWGEMPRNELYDTIREQLKVFIEQVAYNSAMKV